MNRRYEIYCRANGFEPDETDRHGRLPKERTRDFPQWVSAKAHEYYAATGSLWFDDDAAFTEWLANHE